MPLTLSGHSYCARTTGWPLLLPFEVERETDRECEAGGVKAVLRGQFVREWSDAERQGGVL